MLVLHLVVRTNPIEQYTVTKTPFTIGSDKYNDLIIKDSTVDRGHAKIVFKQNQYYLMDEGSTTGTYLKGIKIKPYRLKVLFDGNLIKLGSVIITVKIIKIKNQLPNNSNQSFKADYLRLDAIDLHKSTSPFFGTTLIDNISLSFLPKEFVIIAGVSGGGKSTLMDALNGQRRASGKVLINGNELYKNFNAFKNIIGYVPQDDIVHLTLTVSQALNYAAQLRLPQATPTQRHQRIQQVLQQLQLEDRQQTAIAHLSGGQRKRVSIAVELICQPKLFFLDEATSGLDPSTERLIMQLLRNLANAGSTVVLITHATKNVHFADLVVLLAKGGKLAYFGPTKLVFSYFAVKDFDAIYNLLEHKFSPQKWQKHFNSSAFYQKFISERHDNIPFDQALPQPLCANFFQQCQVLFHRNFNILSKNKISLALITLGVPILGSLNFLLWKPDLFSTKTGNPGQAITMLFVTVIMAVMSGTLATMSEIVSESAIYRRERSAGLGLVPYLASKYGVAFFLALYQSAVLLVFVLAAVKIPIHGNTFLQMYFALFLASFGSMVLGLLVSAIAPNPSVAPLLTILVLVPQVIFGGGILPQSEFNFAAKAINQITVSKYPFESLVFLSKLGADVADDPCWKLPKNKRLSKAQLLKCNCYGQKLFTKCQFPGIGKLKRSSSLNIDLLKAHLFIQGIFDSYKNIFYLDIATNNISMLKLIGSLIIITFFVLLLKS